MINGRVKIQVTLITSQLEKKNVVTMELKEFLSLLDYCVYCIMFFWIKVEGCLYVFCLFVFTLSQSKDLLRKTIKSVGLIIVTYFFPTYIFKQTLIVKNRSPKHVSMTCCLNFLEWTSFDIGPLWQYLSSQCTYCYYNLFVLL